MSALLRVRDLGIGFPPDVGGDAVRAVDGVSFDLADGEVLAVAGESGAGKSTLGRSLLGFFPPGAEVSGSVEVAGTELVGALERRRRPLRGRVVAWIPQTPRAAIHPTLTVSRQVEETIRARGRDSEGRIGRRDARLEAAHWLERVGLGRSGGARAHELSGGMRQRASIALALAGRPRLLVADEPTTALDPDLAADVRGLLLELVAELGLALLWIGHDLEQIAALGGELAVMYRGRWIERGPAEAVLRTPAHPYTAGLVACGSPPSPGRPWTGLPTPRPGDEGSGCAYWSRCPRRDDPRCETERPLLRPASGRERGHLAATWCEPEKAGDADEGPPADGRDSPPSGHRDGRAR